MAVDGRRARAGVSFDQREKSRLAPEPGLVCSDPFLAGPVCGGRVPERCAPVLYQCGPGMEDEGWAWCRSGDQHDQSDLQNSALLVR